MGSARAGAGVVRSYSGGGRELSSTSRALDWLGGGPGRWLGRDRRLAGRRPRSGVEDLLGDRRVRNLRRAARRGWRSSCRRRVETWPRAPGALGGPIRSVAPSARRCVALPCLSPNGFAGVLALHSAAALLTASGSGTGISVSATSSTAVSVASSEEVERRRLERPSMIR